jgi:DNA-binding transcriptional MerR regulator
MHSIGKLAKKFGLSRSTLLYYDSIGLLKAEKRSKSNYRLYSNENVIKLEQIVAYRQMGIALKEIKRILLLSDNKVTKILQDQLIILADKIRTLRQQQYTIIKILEDNVIPEKSGLIDKDAWISILRSIGLDKNGMKMWHKQFEKTSPQAHHDFLIYLGMDEESIKRIRKGILK